MHPRCLNRATPCIAGRYDAALPAVANDTQKAGVGCGCTLETAGRCGGPCVLFVGHCDSDLPMWRMFLSRNTEAPLHRCLAAPARGQMNAPMWSRLAATKYCYNIPDCTSPKLFDKYHLRNIIIRAGILNSD
jgi:hypothetical protein